MQAIEIKTPEDLKNIYGKDGVLMVDLIVKGMGDYYEVAGALTNNWAGAFSDPSRCIQAISIAMIGALKTQVDVLETVYKDQSSSAAKGQLMTIKHSLLAMANDINVSI